MSDIAAYAPHYSWANKSTGWAENIFNEAVAEFIATLPKKSSQLESFLDLKPSTLDDIVKCVSKAQLQYEDRRGDSKIRRCLTSFAQKVHCYGTVMDAVVQQAPECVSLVYGGMKLVLVGVVNHEKSLAIIMDGLCSVADVLPRMENTVNLYPTVQMRKFMIMLYAQIIKFLTVSLSWFKESKALHILHSFTRPPELCYSDLVQKIGNLSQSISTAAQFSSFAEQRDMHSVMNNIMSRQESLEDKVDDKFTKIFQELCELKTTMVTAQTLNSSAQVSMHQQLSQLQLMSFINNLSLNVTLDPTKSLQIYFFARKRQQARQAGGSAFWLAPKMQNWNSSMASSLLMVKGGYKLRNHIRKFSADAIQLLRESSIPVIWALKTSEPQTPTPIGNTTTIDIIKSLILQAINLNPTLHAEPSLSSRLRTYISAKTEADWLVLLASVLEGIPLLYIIIDIQLLFTSTSELSTGFSWPIGILELFKELSERDSKTVVRVLMLSYGSSFFTQDDMRVYDRDILVVGNRKQAAKEMKRGSRKEVKGRRGGQRGDLDLGKIPHRRMKR
ncbi:hypothetical protein BCIN_01g00620 [Botrytis cinerea B05.10]|uniref:DUF7708 domain-containing protein n=1 Tax=Botryotinia fuckeliana (strain B05.10) TaxID=332648 RepID=A0A384J403_BOTFB|nr:hypothetical protein BCIN_01g00620 [Botrytis cinerea B05.10]XP_024545942.1 hypothetical protein BCIN_01g00620 [Botrytis cinerea B05.10]ATZ45244.1 hypothetical protein BCIN_01g00620 [Botrytis cinerea B05.10]ATZ45246.1 hypothetical protein BCIN_01g00620 [Botrytis cinerea B05.10]